MGMKIYLAGPMTGLENFNYPAFFEAERKLYNLGYDVLNPARSDEHHDGEQFSKDKTWYMRKAIGLLLESDGVALMNDWSTSTGARLERDIAIEIGLEIKHLTEWLGE